MKLSSSFHPVNFQLLYGIGSSTGTAHEDCYNEHLPSGIQGTESIFHIRAPCLVRDIKGTRSVGIEKRLYDLLRLIPA